MLPGDGWVNLATHLRSRLLNIDWDHRLPGGPAKVNAKLLGEHRLVPGTLLAAFDGACPVWSGEIESTDPDPQSKLTSIVGRGRVDTMQDGIVYDKTYVVWGVARWVDQRKFVDCNMAGQQSELTLEGGNGAYVVNMPQTARLIQDRGIGLTLDLGPNNLAAYLIATVESSFSAGAGSTIYLLSSNNSTGVNGARSTGVAASGSFVAGTNFFLGPCTAYRFAELFYYWSAAGTTVGIDATIRLKNLVVATSTAYISGGNIILKVDQVAKDIVANAGIPGISTSQALIAAGTTAINELVSDGDNPKSLLDRANAVDGMQWFFTNEPIPTMVLRAEPSAIRWAPLPGEVSLEGGTQASSIVDVYNQVRVRWTHGDGSSNLTTVTLSPDTTVLARVGRTRSADVKVTRPVNSTEAAAIGAAFLRLHAKAPLKASIKTTVPWIRTASGMRMPVSMLTVGDRIRLPIRDSAAGVIGREGVIYGVAVNPRTGVATISLDSDSSLFDRQLAYFESRAA